MAWCLLPLELRLHPLCAFPFLFSDLFYLSKIYKWRCTCSNVYPQQLPLPLWPSQTEFRRAFLKLSASMRALTAIQVVTLFVASFAGRERGCSRGRWFVSKELLQRCYGGSFAAGSRWQTLSRAFKRMILCSDPRKSCRQFWGSLVTRRRAKEWVAKLAPKAAHSGGVHNNNNKYTSF